jgi:MFS family permease
MDNNHSTTTDGNDPRFLSSCRLHRDAFVANNNRYSSIANRQHDYDAVDRNIVHGATGSSEVDPSNTVETVIPITRATMIYVLCAALNSCNLGYDIGVSTNVSKLIQKDIHITDNQREIWVGFINLWASKCSFCFPYVCGMDFKLCQWNDIYTHRQLTMINFDVKSVFGAFAAHFFTDRYGRRTTFFLTAISFIVGLIFTVASSSYSYILLGRSFVGIGVGVGLAVRGLLFFAITFFIQSFI